MFGGIRSALHVDCFLEPWRIWNKNLSERRSDKDWGDKLQEKEELLLERSGSRCYLFRRTLMILHNKLVLLNIKIFIILMVKHNNVIPGVHLRKHWQNNVKVWLNQAARKKRRLQARRAKANANAPRPLERLRPAVRCQTIRYNHRLRMGKGI